MASDQKKNKQTGFCWALRCQTSCKFWGRPDGRNKGKLFRSAQPAFPDQSDYLTEINYQTHGTNEWTQYVYIHHGTSIREGVLRRRSCQLFYFFPLVQSPPPWCLSSPLFSVSSPLFRLRPCHSFRGLLSTSSFPQLPNPTVTQYGWLEKRPL